MTDIIGHDAPIAAFLSAMQGERLHHAWLLIGAEGVGKAGVAMKFAKRMLSVAGDPVGLGGGLDVPDDHRIGMLVDAYTHPDLKLLDRLPKDEKIREKDRREWPDDVERARSITVDQVRALSAIFSKTPSLSARRVVVIDSVDDLERSGANALLKSLEEPPAGTIFLLVSHAPGRLLPTIRSRCRTLRFAGLKDDDMRTALRRSLPEADNGEITALMRAGEGAPGRALSFAGLDIAGIDAALVRLAQSGDPTNAERSALAQKLSLKSAQPRYEAFLARAPAFIATSARMRQGDALGQALTQWEAAKTLVQSARRTSLDAQSVVFAVAGLVAGLAPEANRAKA